MENPKIEHVSDTALWVATYRAQESERKDALFKDPFAKKLAGDRGKRIAASMPFPKAMSFALVTRTTAIDRLVERAISCGVDTVINLGVGLDTRPYRMNLPRNLEWIEVDFPHMIEYKNKKLRAHKPVCNLRRIAADLSQDSERRELLSRLGSETKKALVITEGVIAYLTNDQASRLSRDLMAVPTFHYWIQDYCRGSWKKWTPKRMTKKLKSAPLQFDVPDALGFFRGHGWAIDKNILMLDEADRIGRSMPFLFPWSLLSVLMPKRTRFEWNRIYGYVMFVRTVR